MTGCLREEFGQLHIGVKGMSAYDVHSRGLYLGIVILLEHIKEKQNKKFKDQRSLGAILFA